MNPQDAFVLTDEEAALGYRLLIVEVYGPEPDELQVAYVIDESDIIVKTAYAGKITYLHRRWGSMLYKNWSGLKEPIVQTHPRWHTLGLGGYADSGEAIQQSKFNPDDLTPAPIEKRKFRWEPYDAKRHGA